MKKPHILPPDWRWSCLGDIASYINGRAFKPTEWTDNGLPIIRIQNLNNIEADYNFYKGDIDDKYKVNNGDLLISWSASLDAYIWKRGNAVLNQHIFNVKENTNLVDRKFLYYFVRSAMSRIKTQVHGATMQHITKDKFESIPVPLPPLPEQRRIAEILDRADALREKRRKSIAMLDTLVQSVFLEMFGDPVTNSKGWPITELGRLLEFLTSGSRGWAGHYSNQGSLFFRIQNVGKNRLIFDDIAFINPPQSAESKRTQVKSGDVLLSITADLGRSAVIPNNIGEAYINQHLAILRVKNIEPEYLSAFIASPGGQRQISKLNREGVKAALNFDNIRSIMIPLPPSDLQGKFVTILKKTDLLLSQNKASFTQINDLFFSIQHRAFNGELFNQNAAMRHQEF